MKKLFTVMTLLLALSSPKAVMAFCDLPGFYVGVFGAASIPDTDKRHHHHDSSGSGSGNSSNKTHIHNLDTGYFVSGSIGRRFCEWPVRAELEVGYHHNQKRKHHHNSSGSDNNHHRRNSDANTWSILVNGLYDFQTCWCVKPFLGAGIGYASTELKRHHNNHSSSGNNGDSSSHHRRHKDKNGFAWQLIAGLGYPVCDGWDLSIEYRYFNPAERRLHNHDIGLGVKYTF